MAEVDPLDMAAEKAFWTYPYSDPIRGLIVTGLFSALSVFVGGHIFHRDNLKDEIFTVMFGGFIIGGGFGLISLLLYFIQKKVFLCCITCFSCAAFFVTPLVGLKVYHPDNPPTYAHTLLDWFVGGIIIGAGLSCTIICCLMPVLACMGLSMAGEQNDEAKMRAILNTA